MNKDKAMHPLLVSYCTLVYRRSQHIKQFVLVSTSLILYQRKFQNQFFEELIWYLYITLVQLRHIFILQYRHCLCFFLQCFISSTHLGLYTTESQCLNVLYQITHLLKVTESTSIDLNGFLSLDDNFEDLLFIVPCIDFLNYKI